MSFVTVTRDYIEVLTNVSDSFNGILPFSEFFKESIIYLGKTIQYLFVYIISFRWVHDFTLLPIVVPQLSTAVLKEKLFLENSANIFFNFLEIPAFRQNSLVLGFFNSLSLTFPVSIIHIIAIRRLYIKGIPAAIFSIFGYFAGQLVFITSVIFGLRSIIIPWFSLEPLNYIIGLIVIFRIIYTMRKENLRELTGWDQPQYKNFFLVSFLLAWCEQSSIFQYLGNLNFNATSSILEISNFSPTFNTTFDHILYLLGLSFGCIVFTIFWGVILFQLKYICIRYTPLFLSKFIQNINTGSFILVIALSLSSIPFYGLDYLATGPLGFVSQDRAFKNTVFDQYNLKDSTIDCLGVLYQNESLGIDVSPFDRGRYGLVPETSPPPPFGFEDLNYRGEADWTTRQDKRSSVAYQKYQFLRLSNLVKKKKGQEAEFLASSKQRNETATTFPIKSAFSTSGNLMSDQGESETGLNSSEIRFLDWYTGENTPRSNDEEQVLPIIAMDLQNNTFPENFFQPMSTELKNIDLKIKQKYYSNSVYQNLLGVEVDLLLNRQPSEFRLNAEQELDLYTKRRILTAYYDSLRDYSKLPYSNEFESFFDGTKSFANKVYNQQFKGTLRSVCRLFSLTVDPRAITNENQMVLKYDQPLYVLPTRSSFSPYHEELEMKKTSGLEEDFMDNVISGPLYAGWDEKARKFIITNKFLPRTLAGYKINLPQEIGNKFIRTMTDSKQLKISSSSPSTKIKFTSWPINQKILDQGKKNSIVPFIILYTPQSEFGLIDDRVLEKTFTLPANWETFQRRAVKQPYENIFDYLAPQRGGFVWPGNQKLEIKNIKIK